MTPSKRKRGSIGRFLSFPARNAHFELVVPLPLDGFIDWMQSPDGTGKLVQVLMVSQLQLSGKTQHFIMFSAPPEVTPEAQSADDPTVVQFAIAAGTFKTYQVIYFGVAKAVNTDATLISFTEKPPPLHYRPQIVLPLMVMVVVCAATLSNLGKMPVLNSALFCVGGYTCMFSALWLLWCTATNGRANRILKDLSATLNAAALKEQKSSA